MCGIVGFITKTGEMGKHVKNTFFAEALYINALRGNHSTGMMSLNDDFRWSWNKRAVGASMYLKYKDFTERERDSWCSVGHGRHATVGEINSENAHPFHEGKVILVHNGTIASPHLLNNYDHDIEVDSQQIARSLSKVKPDKAKDVLAKLTGAYALVWFDSRDQSVNMARNSQRPFHLTMNRTKDVMYFMSDGNMLQTVLGRINSWDSNLPIYQLAEKEILKFKKGSLVPEVTKVPPFPVGGYRAPSSNIPSRSAQKRKNGSRSSTKDGDNTRKESTYKVDINGKVGPIPAAHAEMLEHWYLLDPGKDYFFRPTTHMQWSERHGCMYGQMFHVGWNCYINARVVGVPNEAALADMRVPWTVSPIGIDHRDLFDPEETSPLTVIVRAKWRHWFRPHPNTKYDDFDEEEETSHDCDAPGDVEGPNDRKISMDRWIELTEEGCVMCSANISMDTANKILWVGEYNNQPLCLQCSEKATDADND